MKNNMNFSPTKAVAGLAILASILSTSKDSLAQTLANNWANKAPIENTNWVKSNTNSLAYSDPLTFTLQNIANYYPDQQSIDQAHLLIEKIGTGTIKTQINQLIIENIINNISDPKQQIWTILYWLEKYVFMGDDEVKMAFSDKNEVEDVNNFKSSRKFWREYTNRIYAALEEMDKDIEQWKKTLEENRIKIENRMKFITPDMVKSDENIRNIVTRRQQRYKNLNQTPTNPHIISLFAALK